MFARQHAVSQPEKAAIIMGTSGDSVTYAVYERRCDQAAQFLRAAGLRRGDHIAVFMENSIRMLEIEGAAERAGLYFTLINTYLAPDDGGRHRDHQRTQSHGCLSARPPGGRWPRPLQPVARTSSDC